MSRPRLDDLTVFAAVARHASFRTAAAELGISTSATSHALRGLEERLGVRLVNRTTRTVALTEAGERLMARLGPALTDIGTALEEIARDQDRVTGSLRINASRLGATTILGPVLASFCCAYPDVTLEILVDERLSDIVADRCDAGLRLGEMLQQDMVAVRVSQDVRWAVGGAPAYWATRPMPMVPQDLAEHVCIRRRLRGSGALYRWEFEKDGKELKLDLGGPLILDDAETMVRAAVDGLGLVYTGLDYLAPFFADGRLVQVLEDWCPPWPGFFLYYPSRRQTSRALRALIAMLRAHHGLGGGPGGHPIGSCTASHKS